MPNKMNIYREYKGYKLAKNGTKNYPWNIYKGNEWVGFGATLKQCKFDIDNGCFD